MKQEQIQKLIDRENERREENMIDQARQIISAISEEQTEIEEHQKNILDLRAKLKTLETTPLNATLIIG